MRAKERNRSCQVQAFERNQVFFRRSRRVSQGCAVVSNSHEHGLPVGI